MFFFMVFITSFCPLPPLIIFAHCFLIFFFKKWLGPIGTFYSSIGMFLFLIFVIINFLSLFLYEGSYVIIDFGRWFFCLNILDSHLIFCIDFLALISALLVSILTPLALYFGSEYMYRDAFSNRLLYLLNFFAASVIFLFFCYDFFLILVAWEGIGLFSLLLVNFYSMRIYTIKAALKTFVLSRLSDMFLFSSFILTIFVFNTSDLSLIFLQVPFLTFHFFFLNIFNIHILSLISFLIALSGVIKSAQFFFHVWLPDAMEAPTPASALIHSSTLVIAGIFLVLRFALLFEFTIFTNYFLAFWGALTLAFSSITAVFQQDIKKLVAYSTISQIGYLVCGCGFGCYEEVLIYLILHALNKAFLFILVGYLVHFFNNNTDLRFMGAAWIYAFDLMVLMIGLVINLTGLPYSAGFIGKEFLLFQFFRNDLFSLIIRTFWLISFIFTPIYMFLLIRVVFFGTRRSPLSLILNNQLPLSRLFKVKTFPFITTLNTHITGLTTVYILFFFWIFFFFVGEYLFFVLFTFSSLNLIGEWEFLLSPHLPLKTLFISFNTYINSLLFMNVFLSWILVSLSFVLFFRGSYSNLSFIFFFINLGFILSFIWIFFSLFCGIGISIIVFNMFKFYFVEDDYYYDEEDDEDEDNEFDFFFPFV